MKLLWHLIKYNFIFNKIRLIFLSIVSLIILFAGIYFHENPKDTGESILQYSMYIFFVIFTGKMNAKNNLMFDIKQMQSMPMTRSEMVLIKSVADIVHYLPIAIVFLYGFSLSQTNYHIWIIAPIFFGMLTVANIYSLNKRVDFSRMQHSSASFKNSFLFLHKYLGLGLQVVIISSVGMVLLVAFKDNFIIQEFLIVIFLVLAVFTVYSQTLKMLKDETLSYFVIKRDVFRIGWKGAVVGVPMLLFHLVYSGELNIKGLNLGKGVTESYREKIDMITNLEDKKVLMAIVQGEEKLFFKYLSNGTSVPWDSAIMGGYPIHLAVSGKNKIIISKLLELKPDEINRVGKFAKKTPIYSALRGCNMHMIDFLVDLGANINHQDKDGISPMMYAAKRNCYGAVLKFKSLSAKIDLKDKKGRDVFHYIGNDNGLAHIMGHKPKLERELASEKKGK
jgi:hypothetical protein